ncbi:MAG: phospholipid carrier-dependent glycosyltransferase [bacterium]|nr:phospholipid carrier-dependent glycosyltransferase [bacterium]
MLRKIQIKFRSNPIYVILLIVFVIGGLLRFIGTNPGYNLYHADETMSYASAWQMFLSRDLDPHRYDYPSLVPIINLFFYSVFFIPLYWLKYILVHPDVLAQLENFKSLFPSVIVGIGDVHALFWSRYITALISSLMLVLASLVASRMFSSKTIGLFTAILLAPNFRVVLNSHFGLPDIYSAFFLLLSLYAVLVLFEKPTLGKYLLTGITIGLSFSVKFQFFALFPFLAVHIYLALSRGKGLKGRLGSLVSKNLFIALLAALFIAVVSNPYHLINFEEFYDVNYYTYLRYIKLTGLGPTIYGLSYLYHIALTPVLSFAVLLGLALSLWRHPLKSLILLSIVLPFLYTLLYRLGGGALYTRNFVTIIPLLIIFAAVFFNFIFSQALRITRSRYVSAAFVTLVLFLSLFESLKNSLINVQNYIQPWGMTKMNLEVSKGLRQSNVLPNSKIASHPWDFSIVLSKPSYITDQFSRTELDLYSTYSVPELQENGANYALLGLDVIDVANSWWMGKTGIRSWDVPVDVLRNQFPALVVNELTQNTLFSAVKPWQAPDNNYVFVKIPNRLEFMSREIKTFRFDNQAEASLWKRVDDLSGGVPNLLFDPGEGYKGTGSLKMKQFHPFYRVARFISPVFSVEEGVGYKVIGWVRSQDPLGIKQRDGFLRVDFYKDVPQVWNEFTLGGETWISTRYWGEGQWKEQEIVGIAPPDARYATVSFEVGSPEATSFWLDDVTIEQSEGELLAPTGEDAGKRFAVPDKILFPFSQGGL